MRANQVEALVLTAWDKVRRGEAMEDQRLELKRDWPSDAHKAARQIAGFCNAAKGQPAILVVGLCEKHGLVGAANKELSTWWAMVEKEFSDTSPVVTAYAFPIEDRHVVALVFDTTRAPYLVKVPGGGQVETEVPWRAANGTRTARRQELLMLLAEADDTPDLKLHNTYVSYEPYRPPDNLKKVGEKIAVTVEMYLTGRHLQKGVVFPLHMVTLQCYCVHIEELQWIEVYDVPKLEYLGPRRIQTFNPFSTPSPTSSEQILSRTIDSTPTEAIVTGPGLLVCSFEVGMTTPRQARNRRDQLHFSGVVELVAVPSMLPVSVAFEGAGAG